MGKVTVVTVSGTRAIGRLCFHERTPVFVLDSPRTAAFIGDVKGIPEVVMELVIESGCRRVDVKDSPRILTITPEAALEKGFLDSRMPGYWWIPSKAFTQGTRATYVERFGDVELGWTVGSGHLQALASTLKAKPSRPIQVAFGD